MSVSVTMKPQKIAEQTWDGVLYPVPDRTDKAVIVMFGSEGGTEHAGSAPTSCWTATFPHWHWRSPHCFTSLENNAAKSTGRMRESFPHTPRRRFLFISV